MRHEEERYVSHLHQWTPHSLSLVCQIPFALLLLSSFSLFSSAASRLAVRSKRRLAVRLARRSNGKVASREWQISVQDVAGRRRAGAGRRMRRSVKMSRLSPHGIRRFRGRISAGTPGSTAPIFTDRIDRR